MAALKAKLSDLAEIALSLPEAAEGTSWGNRAYVVRKKSFLHFREPRPDAIDPETGERMQDVIIFSVPDQSDKEALVEGDGRGSRRRTSTATTRCCCGSAIWVGSPGPSWRR